MREKTLLILAAFAVPALAAAVLWPAPGATTATTERAGAPLLPALRGHADSLAAIAITGPDGTLTLARAPVAGKPAEGWALRDKGGYPVPAATIRPVLDGLLGLHGVAPKTARPKLYGRLDLGDAGHGSAAHRVVLADAKGASLGDIVLGKQKEAAGAGGAEGIYARVPGASDTWLAEPAVSLPAGALDWIDHAIVDIDAGKVREVVLTQPGAPPLDFWRDKAGEPLKIRDLPATAKLKSETPGSDIETAFHTLELQDVKPAAKLAGKPAGGVHLMTFNGIVADVALTQDNGQTWLTVTAGGDDAKAVRDMTARTKGWAYEIPADRATTLGTKLADLVQGAK